MVKGVLVARFEEKTGDGGVVLSVAGEVDLAVVDELVATVRSCLERADDVLLDLRDVSFIDSSGLGALVLARNEAAAAGRSLALVHVPASLTRLLQLTGLQDSFDVRTDEA